MFIIQLVLFQIFIFSALVVVLRYVIAKRVKLDKDVLQSLSEKYMEKERQLMQEQEEIRKNYTEAVEKARREALEIRANAQDEAKKEAASIVERARQQGEQIVVRAGNSAQAMKTELDDLIAERSTLKACELIGRILTDDIKKDVHEKWTKELIEEGFSTLRQMKIPADIAEAVVISAFHLSKPELESIERAVSDVLGRKIRVKEETDEKIISGIIFKIGSVVLDGSFLNKARKAVDEREK